MVLNRCGLSLSPSLMASSLIQAVAPYRLDNANLSPSSLMDATDGVAIGPQVIMRKSWPALSCRFGKGRPATEHGVLPGLGEPTESAAPEPFLHQINEIGPSEHIVQQGFEPWAHRAFDIIGIDATASVICVGECGWNTNFTSWPPSLNCSTPLPQKVRSPLAHGTLALNRRGCSFRRFHDEFNAVVLAGSLSASNPVWISVSSHCWSDGVMIRQKPSP